MDTCIEVSVTPTVGSTDPITVVVKPCDQTVTTDTGEVLASPPTVNPYETFEIIPRAVYTALAGSVYSPVFDSTGSSMYIYIKSFVSTNTTLNKLLIKIEAYDAVNDTYFTVPGSSSDRVVTLPSNRIILVNPPPTITFVDSMETVLPSQWRFRCDLWGPAGATTEFFVSGSYVKT